MRTPQPHPASRFSPSRPSGALGEHLECSLAAVSSLTSRAGELRSAPSGENRYRATGKRALTLGGARASGDHQKRQNVATADRL